MSSKIENQPSSAENQLLTELQSTVKNRWDEFDGQLPKLLKHGDSQYQKIKSSYEELSSDLVWVWDDQELKQNESIKMKIDTFLWQLNDYLKKENRDKKYDATLTETSRQMSLLRNKIYVAQTVQSESGKLQQEVATNKLASTPDKKQESLPTAAQAAVATTAGATGIVASIESGGKNLEEVTKEVMKPLEKMKKWSSDVGSAWDAGWELVKKGDIGKGIELFFAVLMGGSLKDAIAKYTGKGEKNTKPVENAGETTEETKNEMIKAAENGVIAKTASHLIQGTDKKEYGNFLTAFWKWVINRSLYNDEKVLHQNAENNAIFFITEGNLGTKRIEDLQKMSEQQLVSESGSKESKDITLFACGLIHRMLKNNIALFEQVFGKGNFETLTMRDILRDLYSKKWYAHVLAMNEKFTQMKVENLGDLPKNMFLDFEMKDNTLHAVKWSLFETRFTQFQKTWLTLSLAQNMISIHEKLSVKSFSSISKLSESEKQFFNWMKDEKTFLNPLINSLQHSFWLPNEFVKKMNFENLTIKDLFELYMITWWQPDVTQLNFGEQSLLSLKCMGIFFRLDQAWFGEYMKYIAENKTKYPIVSKIGSQAGALANRGLYNLGSLWTDVVIKFAKLMWIDTTPEVAAAIAGAGGLIWMVIKFLPIGKFFSLLALAAWGVAVVGVAWAQESMSSK